MRPGKRKSDGVSSAAFIDVSTFPRFHAFASLLSYLELHRSLRLLLRDGRPRRHARAGADVTHPQFRQVARP